MTGSITYAPNGWDANLFPRRYKPDWRTLEFDIKWWKQGDPFPTIGDAVGIDSHESL